MDHVLQTATLLECRTEFSTSILEEETYSLGIPIVSLDEQYCVCVCVFEIPEAYANYTATQCTSFNQCNYTVHPVPGTKDGQPNPDFTRSILAIQPNGSEWVWQHPDMSDPLQGGAYHISKTKDAATGERYR